MTNREKYSEQLLDMVCSGHKAAMKNGKLCKCSELNCDECDFYKGVYKHCGEAVNKWANSEYIEPTMDWSKVAVNTPILVRASDSETWYPRYFAKYENGKVYAWMSGATSWSANGDTIDWEYAKLAENEE